MGVDVLVGSGAGVGVDVLVGSGAGVSVGAGLGVGASAGSDAPLAAFASSISCTRVVSLWTCFVRVPNWATSTPSRTSAATSAAKAKDDTEKSLYGGSGEWCPAIWLSEIP